MKGLVIILFISIHLSVFGKVTDLDSIANHYFNEVEPSFFPNSNRLFIEMNVSTEEYPFMDEIVQYITQTIEEFPTSIYSKEELYKGIFYIESDYYTLDNSESNSDESDNSFEFLYSDEFKIKGSYLIDIWFHPEINCLDNINFSYKGLKFGSEQFLLPFFNEIVSVSIYPLHDNLSNGFCNWQFLVENGQIVKALYTNEEYPYGLYEGPISGYYDLITRQPRSSEEFKKIYAPIYNDGD